MVALLDSVVVAGFLDRTDGFHPAADRRIRELAGRDALIASVISYAELPTVDAGTTPRPRSVGSSMI